MIVRSWRGTCRPGAGDAYLKHLTEVVIPEIRTLPGCLGAQVLRDVEAPDRFIVLTRWADLPSVERFAGPDATHAVVPPEARALLADFDRRARHLEVVLEETS